MSTKFVNIVCCLVILSIGITIGKLLDVEYFELSTQISAIDALTLLANIALVFYVATVLERETQDIRIEKDVYIAKITEIEQLLKTFETLSGDYTEIVHNIDTCRMKKNHIFKSIRSTYKPAKTQGVLGIEKNVSRRINLLKRLLTETPISIDTVPKLSIIAGVVTYTSDRITEIRTEVNAINEALFNLKIRINRL